MKEMRDPKKDIPKAGSVVDSIQDAKTWGPDLWKLLSDRHGVKTYALEIEGVGCIVRTVEWGAQGVVNVPNVKIEDIPGERGKVAGRKLVPGFKKF